ncbi:MAG: polysaccharide biosynthesis C-terminal domain-containing protein [Flavobacteriaceae bacterium]
MKNTVVTYLGFGIGAINVLFLYTRFLSEAYFGLVGVILSTSVILMPLLSFGVPNTLVKYYSGYKDRKDQQGFLSFMLMLPLLLILPIALLSWISYDAIAAFLSRENEIVGDYVWYVFLIGLAMAYFEVFYSWSKVHLKSVFGNFMKEVFARICISAALVLVAFNWLSVEGFLKCLVGIYLLRTAIMKLYAYSLSMPKIAFSLPPNAREVLGYSAFIVLGGSVAVILLEIDRFMINQFIAIENVAYYTVAIFIATVIAVPSRAMHQITYPMTAEIMNNGGGKALKELYKKSSLTLFIIAGLIFLLVLLNLEELYQLLPPNYRGGFTVVLFIGLAKVFDALMGNNNAILFNSEHYRVFLLMGIFLAVLTIVLNLWFIPRFGINGAAFASFTAIALYNIAKLIFVKLKFDMHPFTFDTFKVLGLLIFVGVLFYLFSFSFHPIVNIILKSMLMSLMYIGILYRFKISEDIFGLLSGWFKR